MTLDNDGCLSTWAINGWAVGHTNKNTYKQKQKVTRLSDGSDLSMVQVNDGVHSD
jgi:hypothetical protein